MTDISKLKAEAEVAHQFAVISIGAITTYGKAEDIADALIRATIAQIALQAAEKEAEVRDQYRNQGEKWMPIGNGIWMPMHPAPIADDGWIKWEGGECPIPGIETFEWKGRDERICKEVKYLAEKLRWKHCNSCGDIIAYRIISPAADRVNHER